MTDSSGVDTRCSCDRPPVPQTAPSSVRLSRFFQRAVPARRRESIRHVQPAHPFLLCAGVTSEGSSSFRLHPWLAVLPRGASVCPRPRHVVVRRPVVTAVPPEDSAAPNLPYHESAPRAGVLLRSRQNGLSHQQIRLNRTPNNRHVARRHMPPGARYSALLPLMPRNAHHHHRLPSSSSSTSGKGQCNNKIRRKLTAECSPVLPVHQRYW